MPTTTKTNDELVALWQNQPAPLLGLLHAFHDRDGYLSDDSLSTISSALKIPLAELFATVTFYHHFAREAPGQSAPRVCTGPICTQRGARQLLASLDGAIEMPCAGRCDAPIPVLVGDQVHVGASAEELALQPSPLPIANPGGYEECVFAHIRMPDRHTLAGYRHSGGYEGLSQAVQATPSALIDLITESKLAGRGGAGFPTGQKWRAVAQAQGEPKAIVCNADEGEPGCFKDRALLDYDPHAIIEGMVLAAYATGAQLGFIYLRYEYPQTALSIEKALQEARAANLLGSNICGKGFDFDIHLRRGAGAYICGEEGSLLNSLEGKHPYPRNRPPFPVTHGFNDLPTAVNNVETLVAVAPIVKNGAAWYHSLGLGEHVGTKLISLSGDVQRPGNYEVPFGLPLQTLLQEWAGGALEGRSIQAVTMAGLSGGFLAGTALSATLDEPSIRAHGSFLGAGGIMVFDDSRNMVEIAHQAMTFFAEESCGKCFPCRIGTQRLSERLDADVQHGDIEQWHGEVADMGAAMKATSACGLGMAAPHITESLLKYFPEQVSRHLDQSK
ncbi:MAG: NADH-quinone oxidoreductase subunit F [Candidatus Latescibacterota bacterium]|jgi:NADH-quinone oxidoreductase subunit F